MIPIIVALQLYGASLPITLTPSDSCGVESARSFASKTQLPRGVLDAFGAPIADNGQPFQVGDVRANPPLPIYRFVSAEQRGCTISVVCQYGGRGSGTTAALLVGESLRWRLLGNLIYHDRSKSDVPAAPDDRPDAGYYALGITSALGTIEAYKEICSVPNTYQIPEVATARARADVLFAAAGYPARNIPIDIERSKELGVAQHRDNPSLLPCWAFLNQVRALQQWLSVTKDYGSP